MFRKLIVTLIGINLYILYHGSGQIAQMHYKSTQLLAPLLNIKLLSFKSYVPQIYLTIDCFRKYPKVTAKYVSIREGTSSIFVWFVNHFSDAHILYL